jgi:hypothetical protein
MADKPLQIKATVLILLCLHLAAQAQTSDTNGLTAPDVLYQTSSSTPTSISNTVRVASGLRVGMAGADVQKYLQDHGLTQTNIYSISADSGRLLTSVYRLAGDTTLLLDLHCTNAPAEGLSDWSDPVLDRAYICYISNQGTNVISVVLTNATLPDQSTVPAPKVKP